MHAGVNGLNKNADSHRCMPKELPLGLVCPTSGRERVEAIPLMSGLEVRLSSGRERAGAIPLMSGLEVRLLASPPIQAVAKRHPRMNTMMMRRNAERPILEQYPLQRALAAQQMGQRLHEVDAVRYVNVNTFL